MDCILDNTVSVLNSMNLMTTLGFCKRMSLFVLRKNIYADVFRGKSNI